MKGPASIYIVKSEGVGFNEFNYHQLDESDEKNWPFSVCSWQILFVTSVLVAKNATGLNFTILCSFSFQGCLGVL